MGVVACQPVACHRGSAICFPKLMVHELLNVHVLYAGMALEFRRAGCKQFIISLHLPHSQRTDCIDVWHDTTQDLRRVLSGLRYTCEVYIGADLNVDSDSSDSPSEFLLQEWMLDWQLSI